MSKIMLVEDDQSLREIYSIRLTAEGYEVVSAGDGEEALALAVKERPDLIVSDVMMPKISGFDMLDILRSTPETKDIKVIMMTALSSEDQRQRGESLGADRYLVKSQVGIEDVINAVHEVLGDKAAAGAAPAVPSAPASGAPAQPAPAPAPSAAAPQPQPAPAAAPAPQPQPASQLAPQPQPAPAPQTPPAPFNPAQ
ncbi:response regulator [Candidatus Saccharibacteria bacterium]|nr:response regulator [Candidatus Saccharibacteria bacterium]